MSETPELLPTDELKDAWDEISSRAKDPKFADCQAGLTLACAMIERRRQRRIPARPDGEAVAWLYESWNGENSWGKHFSFDKPAGNKWQRNIVPLYASPPPAGAGVRKADPLADAWHEIKRASEREGYEEPARGAFVVACAMIERRRLRMGLQPIGSIPSALAPSGEKK